MNNSTPPPELSREHIIQRLNNDKELRLLMSEAITAPDSLIVQTVEYLRDIKGGGAYK